MTETLKRYAKEIMIGVACALTAVLIVQLSIVQETSMLPNLQPNDCIVINKLAYTGGKVPKHDDIVVFKTDSPEKKLLVKRVVGIEGDIITIKDGKLYRNGMLINEFFLKEGTVTEGKIQGYIVPENKVFVLGDNREVSIDSRNPDVGAVSQNAIVGKAVLRVFPISEITSL